MGKRAAASKSVQRQLLPAKIEAGFTFGQLSEDAKQRALARRREIVGEDLDILDSWLEDCIAELGERGVVLRHRGASSRPHVAAIGIHESAFYYSLGNSQGDGCSFGGTIEVLPWLDYIAKSAENQDRPSKLHGQVDRERAVLFARQLRILLIDAGPGVWIGVTVHGPNQIMEFSWSDEPYHVCIEILLPTAELLWEEIEKFVGETARDVCKDFEHRGYVEQDYLFSDEALIEDIEANEMRFDEDGEEI